MTRYLLAAMAAVILNGCATAPPFDEGGRCESNLFAVDAQFPGGAMNACRMTAPDEVEILLRPEDVPINPSPWYALRLSPVAPGHVSVNFIYETHPHRYRPKLSNDGSTWRYVDDDRLTVSDDGMQVQVRVALDDTPVFLTGQELLTREDYDHWLSAYRQRDDLNFSVIGLSIEERQIEMLASRPDNPQGSVVLVGRQHPPELTGALAMQAFVDEVLGNSSLAREFRQRFGLVIAPLLNPDGAYRGHWRHNSGSTDLNRDWGPFEQPETRAVRRVLDRLDQQSSTRPVVFLDFHSTRRNVFYTQVVGDDGTDYGFTRQWLARSRQRLPDYEFERAERHQSEQATSKNYMFDRFAIPAITYEVGDESDRDLLRLAARVFAQEMMNVLLENHTAP